MSIIGKLKAESRNELGSLACRRLRRKGQIPGNLYGHKQATVNVAVSEEELVHLVKTGVRVLDLDIGGEVSTALFREVQWDSMGDYIQHVDFLRVDANERLEVEVHVELKGTAPGVLAGGILDHSLRTLHIECLAIQIPDAIVIKIGNMEVGQSIHVREVEVPPNTKILNNPEAIVVRIAEPGSEEVEATPVEGGPTQPELIKKKLDEETEEEK